VFHTELAYSRCDLTKRLQKSMKLSDVKQIKKRYIMPTLYFAILTFSSVCLVNLSLESKTIAPKSLILSVVVLLRVNRDKV